MLYGPGAKAGTLYSPWPFEETTRVALVSTLCTTTRAPATARLDGSLIKPEIPAFWARKGDAASRAVTNNASRPAGRRSLPQRVNKAMTAGASMNLLSHRKSAVTERLGAYAHSTLKTATTKCLGAR